MARDIINKQVASALIKFICALITYMEGDITMKLV